MINLTLTPSKFYLYGTLIAVLQDKLLGESQQSFKSFLFEFLHSLHGMIIVDNAQTFKKLTTTPLTNLLFCADKNVNCAQDSMESGVALVVFVAKGNV